MFLESVYDLFLFSAIAILSASGNRNMGGMARGDKQSPCSPSPEIISIKYMAEYGVEEKSFSPEKEGE